MRGNEDAERRLNPAVGANRSFPAQQSAGKKQGIAHIDINNETRADPKGNQHVATEFPGFSLMAQVVLSVRSGTPGGRNSFGGIHSGAGLYDQGDFPAGANDGCIGKHCGNRDVLSQDFLEILSDGYQIVGSLKIAGHAANQNLAWMLLNDLAKAQGFSSF